MLIKSKCTGFSLIELMITILIGAVLMIGLLTFLVSGLVSNKNVLESTKLNQEMRSIMLLISRDLRRSGYWGSTATTGNPFQTISTSTPGCVLFSYDRLNAGPAIVPDNEKYGYQLRDNTIMMRSGGATSSCTPSETNTWEALTDSSVIKINTLTFTPDEAKNSVTIKLSGELTKLTKSKITLTDTIQLQNTPITFN